MNNLPADSALVAVIRMVEYVTMPGRCVCRVDMFTIHDAASLLFSPDVCTSFEKSYFIVCKITEKYQNGATSVALFLVVVFSNTH